MLPWRRRGSRPNGDGRQWAFEERRRSLPHRLAVLKVDAPEDRHTLLGYAESITRTGMMIGTVWPKRVGSRHLVEFALPDPADLVVRCTCRVAWARPHSEDRQKPGMGLEFLDLPEPVADRIDSLWQGDARPPARVRRTWSEFDHAWIPWRPPRAAEARRTRSLRRP